MLYQSIRMSMSSRREVVRNREAVAAGLLEAGAARWPIRWPWNPGSEMAQQSFGCVDLTEAADLSASRTTTTHTKEDQT